MSTRRFMMNSRSIRNGYASFDGDLFNHMVRVLRMSPGDPLVLVDEQGIENRGIIDQVDREWVVIKIVESLAAPEDFSSPRLTLCQALPKGEKTELILQKGTELGIHDFRLFGGLRSVARLRESSIGPKLERWQKIVTEAARQCGRRTIPRVAWYTDAAAAAESADHELRLLLWEGERTNRLKQVLSGSPPPGSAMVVVGPEGGIDPKEVELFLRHEFRPVSLGSRILRTETAALAITAVLQYIWEDI